MQTAACRGRKAKRSAVTLIEAMAALVLLALAGSTLLLATHTTVSATTQSTDEVIARGIASLVLDEAFGLPYADPDYTAGNPNNVGNIPLGGNEGPQRIDWDDLDDFAGVEDNNHQTLYQESPPLDSWGKKLGTGASSKTAARHPSFSIRPDYFDDWRVETNVCYVPEANLAQPQDAGSYFRAFEVRVYRRNPDGSQSLLASLRRVHAHVPKSP